MVRCERCGTAHDSGDRYCRRCGGALPPGRGASTALALATRSLPATWTPMRPVLQGLAALVVGAVVEVLRREAVRRLAGAQPRALSLREPAGLLSLTGGEPEGGTEDYEMQETVVIRRVVRRRR